MPEPLVHSVQNATGDRTARPQHVGDETSGGGHVPSRTQDHPGMMGRQEFSQVHTADNSRNHFGNVYNNVYQNDTVHPEFAKVTLELMDALAFKGMTDRIMAIGPACAETCTWFLHRPEYTSWRDPARRHAHNGVLWIKGKAGTGKSTLMRYIHDHAQNHYQDDIDIAFFLNGRSPDQLVKSVEGMYRSVLHQLYDRIPRLKEAAAKRVATTNKQIWSIGILEDMIRQSVLHLASDERATIYIDALDECELDQVRSAVEFFEGLSRSATTGDKQLLICFSSRYYPHITMQSHEEVKLDTLAEHSADIKTFLASEFTIRSPFRSELQAEIEERCSGIFLWVVLVVKLLKRNHDKGATRSQLRATIESLPHELNELFAKITEAAGADFAVAMRWVLCARASLHPRQLYFAIQTGSGRLSSACRDTSEISTDSVRNYVLHVSRGLIECTWESEHKERVQFVHESVREYLSSWGLKTSKGASLHSLEITSHAKMLEDCQNYLKLCARCRSKFLPPKVADIGYKDSRNFLYAHPILYYTLAHAFKHMELAYTTGLIDHAILDTFPLRDFVAFYNIRAVPQYNEVERHPIQCAIIADHSATLLMLLIRFRCHGLVDFMLRSPAPTNRRLQGLNKRSQALAKSPVAAESDLKTLCGGLLPSPLQAAVASGETDLVRLLLERGANVNMSDMMWVDGALQLYDSPLRLAELTKSTPMLKLLLDHGARVDTLSPLSGWSALHQACRGYNLEQIRLLLNKVINIDLRTGSHDGARLSHKSWTALHIACEGVTWLPVLRALLVAGADVHATMSEDETPLIIVAHNGNLEEAKILIEYGANTEYRSKIFGTAITAAHPSIVEALSSWIRMRALQGRNNYLRPAPQPHLPRERVPSCIAAPVQPQSRRRELPLQYRHPPQGPCRPLVVVQAELVDALTDSSLQLWTASPEGKQTNNANGRFRSVRPGSELGTVDESDWSNARNRLGCAAGDPQLRIPAHVHRLYKRPHGLTGKLRLRV